MKSIETEGKTVDQAIELGLYRLGATRDQVKIRIIEEAGLFNKAKVRLSLNQTSDTEEEVKKLAMDLVEKMGLNLRVYTEEIDPKKNENKCILVDLSGSDTALAIGKHGDCLEAIGNILNNIYNKNKTVEETVRIVVDSNHYREKREATLTVLAKKMAAKAVREGRNVKLEPMTSYERRLIHSALTDNTKVITESEGTEPNRYVVIKLANVSNRRKEMAEARKESPITEQRADND